MGFLDSISEAKENHRLEKERKMHEKFMQLALKEAQRAYELKEVPIGCVIVRNGSVIAKGYNRRNTDRNVLNHAELDAIRTACKKVKDWRLEDCDIYITLEPCPMCAGAIVQARIPRVIIGSMNPKAGCAGSVINLLDMQGFNHQCEVVRGILEDECSELLSGFFRELRAEHGDVGEAKAEDARAEDAADEIISTKAESSRDAKEAETISAGNAIDEMDEPTFTKVTPDESDERVDETKLPASSEDMSTSEIADSLDPIESAFDEAVADEFTENE